MKKGMKVMMMVLAAQAAVAAAPAAAEVYLGVGSYSSQPAAKRWSQPRSATLEQLSTAAAALDGAVRGDGGSEAGQLLAQVYSGAAVRGASAELGVEASAPVAASAAPRGETVTRSSDEDGGKDKDKDKEKDKDGKKDEAKEETPKPEAAPAVAAQPDAVAAYAAIIKEADDRIAADKETAKKAADDRKSAMALGFWTCVLALSVVAMVVLI